MSYYFAYGSNLHPLRLAQRVPSARLLGAVTLPGYRLVFNKLSIDGSSKCNIERSTCENDCVYGAIYTMDAKQKQLLDKFEGKGYTDVAVNLDFQGETYRCFSYQARASYIVANVHPYHWYKALLLSGGEYLGFPRTYLDDIRSVMSIDDPDATRKNQLQQLLEHIRQYQA